MWDLNNHILTPSAAFAAGKPNILLICVDDLKPALGCYGDTTAITPAINAFAKRATHFERAYCNQAVCGPARNALITGLRPETLGLYEITTFFRKSIPGVVTLPQTFKQAGYQVGFMKPHLPFVAPKKYWDLYDRAKVPMAEFQKRPEGAPKYAPKYGGELTSYSGVRAAVRMAHEMGGLKKAHGK